MAGSSGYLAPLSLSLSLSLSTAHAGFLPLVRPGQLFWYLLSVFLQLYSFLPPTLLSWLSLFPLGLRSSLWVILLGLPVFTPFSLGVCLVYVAVYWPVWLDS